VLLRTTSKSDKYTKRFNNYRKKMKYWMRESKI